ncbi:hypothetical protein [Flavobacterium sp.]|uniref:hypothetical protein n=1 Tax=Flavobacterium sp. TaxID=239 RepID=UPI002B4B6AF1|nr:hypothetical protein [Flavobacterium sp.]HLP63864.1 hypothetical protein [Flavobacterium sp.]
MKSFNWIVIGCFTLISIVSCKNVERQNAEKNVKVYSKFVDSVEVLQTETAVTSWGKIQQLNDQKKTNAVLALNKINNKETIEKELNESTIQFELFKSKIMVEQEKIKLETTKIKPEQKSTETKIN